MKGSAFQGLGFWMGVLVAALVLPLAAQAQTAPGTKYWVFFTDKGGAKAAEAGYVSEAALARRQLRGAARRDTRRAALDAPVARPYLAAVRQAGGEVAIESRWLNAVSAVLTPGEVAAVEALPFVRAVRPVGRLQPPTPRGDAAPPPPYAPGKSLLLDYGPSLTQLAVANAVEPLEADVNGAGVLLGFLDTTYGGFSHPAFDRLTSENRLLGVQDFTTSIGPAQRNAHGQNVASVAVGFEEGQLIGPAWGASVLAATTEYAPSETNAEEDAFVAGLEWLEREGADVVNISLGYTDFDEGERSYTPDDLDGNTGVTTRAADVAASLGVVVVTSAGNSGCSSPDDCWFYIGTPADADSVIAVGGILADSSLVGFSSRGPTADGRIKPDVVAMAAGVVVATGASGYALANGTSFSSPLVAGIVCQILQVNSSLNPIEVRDLLRQTADRPGAPGNEFGWGVVNAAAAVEAARQLVSTETPEGEAPLRVDVYPNPARDRATLRLTLPASASARLARAALYNALGQRVARLADQPLTPGLNTLSFDVRALPAGLYLYTLAAGPERFTGTFVVR